MIDTRRFVCFAATFLTVLLPTSVYSGDEDEKPAYMIYIDPETGKYTTEDPDKKNPSDRGVTLIPATDHPKSNLPLLILAGGAIAAVLIGGLLKHQRKKVI